MAQQVTITLNLSDLRTSAVTEMYKWGEVNRDNNDDNYQRISQLQYKSTDSVDSALVNLYIGQRVRRIADLVSEYLSNFTASDSSASFSLILPAGWNQNTFASLAKLFGDYVVDGTVADWFTNAGIDAGKIYNTKALEHATGIQRNIYKKNSTIS